MAIEMRHVLEQILSPVGIHEGVEPRHDQDAASTDEIRCSVDEQEPQRRLASRIDRRVELRVELPFEIRQRAERQRGVSRQWRNKTAKPAL